MAEPQHGHGVLGVAGSEASSSGLGAGGAASSRLQASARLSAFTPLWAIVDEEPADELVRHGLVTAGSVDPIVLDLERYRAKIRVFDNKPKTRFEPRSISDRDAGPAGHGGRPGYRREDLTDRAQCRRGPSQYPRDSRQIDGLG